MIIQTDLSIKWNTTQWFKKKKKKKNRLLTQAAPWTNLKIIINEGSQAKKSTYYVPIM